MTRLFGPATPEFPDLGEATLGCCWGTALNGPSGCDCWEPEYDLEQSDPKTGTLPMPRPKMCDDCAFRPSSPERRGDESYENNEGLADLEYMVAKGEPFYCHQGIRLPSQWVHPSGAAIDGHPGAYDPPILGQPPIPYKANGEPADICAGWWSRYARRASVSAQTNECRNLDACSDR